MDDHSLKTNDDLQAWVKNRSTSDEIVKHDQVSLVSKYDGGDVLLNSNIVLLTPAGSSGM
jgi:hypothetical protein